MLRFRSAAPSASASCRRLFCIASSAAAGTDRFTAPASTRFRICSCSPERVALLGAERLALYLVRSVQVNSEYVEADQAGLQLPEAACVTIDVRSAHLDQILLWSVILPTLESIQFDLKMSKFGLPKRTVQGDSADKKLAPRKVPPFVLKNDGLCGPRVTFYFLKIWKLAARGPIMGPHDWIPSFCYQNIKYRFT